MFLNTGPLFALYDVRPNDRDTFFLYVCMYVCKGIKSGTSLDRTVRFTSHVSKAS